MINLQLKSLIIPIDSVKPDPKNARKHPERNIASVEASLKEFGQQKPIVICDGIVIAGNATLTAATRLGWKEIAAVRFDKKDKKQAIAFAIADNRTAELADWDMAVLKDALLELDNGDLNLLITGFNQYDLKKMIDWEGEGGNTDPDDIPSPMDKAIVKRGEVWALGNHRLMCGDSSNAADVDKLVGGATMQMVNTDPPYNVKVEPRSNNAIAAGLSSFKGTTHHQQLDVKRHPSKSKGTTKQMRAKDRPLANDFMTDEAFDKILKLWFGNMARVLDPGRSFYIWGGYANVANYPAPLKEVGFYFSQAIIWVKQHPVMTRKDFMGNHEWCFYGWKEGKAHFFTPEIKNATDVWQVKKVSPQKMVHLTEKPVELAELAMMYSSRPKENVLDLFGGSGSTLMAAEKTKRKAFLMEMDPPYCDVIIKRWEDYTKKKAKRA